MNLFFYIVDTMIKLCALAFTRSHWRAVFNLAPQQADENDQRYPKMDRKNSISKYTHFSI